MQHEQISGTNPSVRVADGVVNISFPDNDGEIIKSTIAANLGIAGISYVNYLTATQVIGQQT